MNRIVFQPAIIACQRRADITRAARLQPRELGRTGGAEPWSCRAGPILRAALGAFLFMTALALALGAADAIGQEVPPLPYEMNHGVACMALAGFSEARGEAAEGEAAVQLSILNRTRDRRWPESICDVVLAHEQFHGVSRWAPPRSPWRIDRDAWERSTKIATRILDRDLSLVPKACRGATSFASSAPVKGQVELCAVGAHRFFAD